MREIIKSNTNLNQQYELIKSIPGVGEQTAIYLIISTKGFRTFNLSRKFACYSVVAYFEYCSGFSINGRQK